MIDAPLGTLAPGEQFRWIAPWRGEGGERVPYVTLPVFEVCEDGQVRNTASGATFRSALGPSEVVKVLAHRMRGDEA